MYEKGRIRVIQSVRTGVSVSLVGPRGSHTQRLKRHMVRENFVRRDHTRRELGPEEYARLARQTARLPEVDDNDQHHTATWTKIEDAMNVIKESQRIHPPGDTRHGTLPRPPKTYFLRDKKQDLLKSSHSENKLCHDFEQL